MNQYKVMKPMDNFGYYKYNLDDDTEVFRFVISSRYGELQILEFSHAYLTECHCLNVTTVQLHGRARLGTEIEEKEFWLNCTEYINKYYAK